ncbi:hypothetical protein E1B28_012522 [Marasmius oreades]|nr:uncharacterized protein E1B28_012522 [Marasmius oreades]KAG7088540.1 hypothetical protein E1B28_012522 [Marasmius oreades]
MTLVTRENAAKRPGWKVMPSGRMVRSMRMRPEKPLPPCSNNSEKNQVSSVTAKKKKKFRPLDSRARIRTIDVTKWNGEYLRGSLLDGQIIASPLLSRTEKNTGKSSSKGEVRDMEFETDPTMPSPSICPSEFTPAAVPQTSHVEQQVADSPPHPATTADDFALERAQNLSLFNALLGDTERDGRESDSDIDESRVIEVEDYTGEEHYEIVPAAAIHGRTQTRDRDTPMEVEEPPPKEGETAVQPPPTAMKPTVSLKDLFAPREEDVGFSLLDHLDLGRDEEDDLDMGPFMMIPQGTEGEISNVTGATDSQVQPVNAPAVASTISKSSIHQRINLDPKTPLFFPKLETLFTTTTTKGSLVSPSPLYQSQTEEQIRQRWEENKVELTRGWKKRWREAMKVKRRRGGGKDLEVDL